MSIREIEKLLGHSLDDDQLNREFSLDRAQHADLGLRWRGVGISIQSDENPVAENSGKDEKMCYEPPKF